MWYANDVRTGALVRATPNATCECPLCGDPVLPKCGDLIPWHFAHQADHDCDRWSEPESEWHLNWKQLVAQDRREVTMGNHRADVVSISGKTIIELQHSPISPKVIAEREAFYRDRLQNRWMIWLFDVRHCADNIEVRQRDNRYRLDESLYIWKHAKKSLITATAPVYLDIWGDPHPIVLIWDWLPERTSAVEDSITGREVVERVWPRAFIGRTYDRQRFIKRFFTGRYEEVAA